MRTFLLIGLLVLPLSTARAESSPEWRDAWGALDVACRRLAEATESKTSPLVRVSGCATQITTHLMAALDRGSDESAVVRCLVESERVEQTLLQCMESQGQCPVYYWSWQPCPGTSLGTEEARAHCTTDAPEDFSNFRSETIDCLNGLNPDR